MTLYDIIMGNLSGLFTKKDWSQLGHGEKDEDTIKKMLMDGYAAVVDED
jgi:hypothetical protein